MASGGAVAALVWALFLAALAYSGGLNFLAVSAYNFAAPGGLPSDADHALWTLALPLSKHASRKFNSQTVGSLDRDASGAAEMAGLPFFAEALPMFLIALLVEVVLTALKGEKFFSYQMTISSLSTGLLNQTVGGLLRVLTIMPYCFIHEHFRVVDLSGNKALMWAVAFVGIDFGYYWFHRMAHEVNLLWGFHEVHHSSEEYNLATALRQTVFAGLDGFVFYLPVAFFVPPDVHIAHKAFNLLFQFWIHTRHIPKLPWPIEFVFNTPSHHRVHHGRNPWCIDCNYGGTLIIWDRLFGTFCEEREDDAIVYGIVPPLKSFEPWAAQLHHLREIGRRMSRTPAPEAAKHIVAGPGRLWVAGKDGKAGRWKDFPVPELGHRANPVATPLRALPTPLALYTLLSFSVAGAAFLFLALQPSSASGPTMQAIGVAAFVGSAVWTIGLLHDRSPAAAAIEPARALVALAVCAWVAMGWPAPEGDGPLDWLSLERVQALGWGLQSALAVLAVQAALSAVVCPLYAAETAAEKEAWRLALAEQGAASKRTFEARTKAAAGESKKRR
ncbi:hypothetical protein FNF29_00344 [Cafeteria roenbergensis]|uniref:Fatty acid hydroxylase domain-containing protein n=1 Tax=Cafeteria roenbergensis TaxID=33653 RepID=A0A5A8D072_CAFRO|nr:hypothetical protein FNF29_00344 [Cafeteria roenbergensis]|eukprot:KAA0157770.1 hypothetical protein FNF29_00344 [Cafeteria roenbergensis]